MQVPDSDSNYSAISGWKTGGKRNSKEEALVPATAVLL